MDKIRYNFSSVCWGQSMFGCNHVFGGEKFEMMCDHSTLVMRNQISKFEMTFVTLRLVNWPIFSGGLSLKLYTNRDPRER